MNESKRIAGQTDVEMPRDFGFGSEEEILRDLARKLLDDEMPIEKMRRLVAADPETTYEAGQRPGWDESLWKRCVELGWTGLAVPEEDGGIGVKMVGIAGLVEAVGHHALASPLITTLNASYVLRESKTDEARACLSKIADGMSASLAVMNARGEWDPWATGVSAKSTGEGVTLSGTAYFVQDAFKVDAFVVLARHDEGDLLCVIRADANGLKLSQDQIHDLTRDQGTLRLSNVEVPQVDIVSFRGSESLRLALPSILTTIAADLCGSSEWQLQTTVEYAKTRKQFDRPIGFFQAVKHPLVNAMIEIDRARSLLYHAACCIDSASGEALRIARMAKSSASDAGSYMSDRSVQLHGGIGFTWECEIHLYFKRSMHNQVLYGDGQHHRAALADEIVGPIQN